jgi:formate dehydrogenase maturation protein FdhE
MHSYSLVYYHCLGIFVLQQVQQVHLLYLQMLRYIRQAGALRRTAATYVSSYVSSYYYICVLLVYSFVLNAPQTTTCVLIQLQMFAFQVCVTVDRQGLPDASRVDQVCPVCCALPYD